MNTEKDIVLFDKKDKIVLWLNLLLWFLPLILINLPLATVLGANFIIFILILILFLIVIWGVFISMKYFKKEMKKLSLGQKLFLAFPILNLLILVLITIATFV